MNCIECQENVVANLEGALDPGTAAEFQNHLAGCPACQGEHTKMAECTNGSSHTAKPRRTRPSARRHGSHSAAASRSAFGRDDAAGLAAWALGCGAATAAIVLAALLISPRPRPTPLK